jgi:FKBP-type peptidyl-prolyl cis-trans isomerase SlyD
MQQQVGKDKVVAIDYTLTGTDGQVIDSSRGGEPLTYLHGAGNIIPGLERALEGKAAGDEITTTVAPDQGYGQKNPGLVQPVPRAQFPGVKDIAVGQQFQAQTNHGPRVVTVVGLTDDTVTVDANHPLAGETLNFAVKVVEVRDATQQELDHGHAHGPGGQHHA